MKPGQSVTNKAIITAACGYAAITAVLLAIAVFVEPTNASPSDRVTLAAAEAPAFEVVDDGKPQRADDGLFNKHELGIMERVQDWLARANRAFQTTVVRRLSTPTTGSGDAISEKLKEVSDEDRAAKDADAERQAKLAADHTAAEAARKAENERKAADDAKAKQEADAKQAIDEKAAADAKAKEDADAKAMLEDAKRNADDAIKAAQKVADERQSAEEQRKADEEAKRQADENANRQAAEEQRARDEARKADDARKAAEAQAEKDRAARAAEASAPADVTSRRSKSDTETRIASSEDDRPSASRHRHVWRGPAVKRWILRSGGQCAFAGRRHRGWYTVRSGDTLWLIAKKYYGHGWRYRRILHANRWLKRHPNVIHPCQRLYLPRWHR